MELVVTSALLAVVVVVVVVEWIDTARHCHLKCKTDVSSLLLFDTYQKPLLFIGKTLMNQLKLTKVVRIKFLII